MRRSVLAGVLAACAGMAAAHLIASLFDPASSPVLAVGSTVIDATPTPMKEWAIRRFGTADKKILVGSVLAMTLLFAGAAGIVARRRLAAGVTMILGLTGLAGAAALIRPGASAADALPALVAAVTGVAILVTLLRAPVAVEGRRGFLIGSGALVIGGIAMAGAGQWIVRARSRISDIVLPRAARPLPSLAAGVNLTGISPFRTPNRDFYRVDTKLSVPLVDHHSWRLRVDGMVERELTYSYDELLDLAVEEHDITLTCVSNTVGGKLVGAARWLGVPVRTVLDSAGVSANADQLLSVDVDGFEISTPLTAITDGRAALIALGMNGEVLPREHGFPARLVVPGLYGFVGATKWIERLRLTTYDDNEAYWTKRGWATDAPIKLSSRIDTPKALSTIEAGRRAIGGVAWAQHNGVAGVEVRIDGGPWRPAIVGPDAGVDYWRQWYLPWDAEPGRHTLAVRAIGVDGTVQSPVRAGSFPDGSSGIQELVVMVRGGPIRLSRGSESLA